MPRRGFSVAGGGWWRITLGWAEPALRQNSLTAVLQSEAYALPRIYKAFEVDAQTGIVKWMKTRELA